MPPVSQLAKAADFSQDERSVIRSRAEVSMRRRRRTPLLLVLSLAFVCANDGCSSGMRNSARVGSRSASDSSEAVDTILGNYYEAIGGYARLKGIRVRRMQGVYQEGTLIARTEIVQRRPNLRRVIVHGGAWDHYEGFDGAAYEFHRDSGKVGHLSRVTGEAALAIIRGAEFDESFVDYAAKGFRASVVGRESVLGLDVYRLRIVRTDNWMLEYLFEVHSHLLVGLQKAMPLHAEGSPVTSLTLYQDWRFTNRLLVPFSGVEVNLATGKVMNTLHWDTIELNGSIEASELCPPTR